MALRKHNYTIDGSHWDLSTLSLSEAPVDDLSTNVKARKIDLSNNIMTALPTSFTALTHLIYLDLSKNQLTQLPAQFGNLNKLQHLDLYGNRLKSLPPSFGQLERLRWLDLKGNPLEQGLKSVAGDCANTKQCQKCAISVVKYMRSENERIVYEEKQKEIEKKRRFEAEKRMADAKRMEKEKKKAKNVRRAQRKAKERSELNGSVEDHSLQNDDASDGNKLIISKEETFKFSKCFGRLLKIITFLLLFITFLITAISIGIHLRKGAELKTLRDVQIALNNGFVQLYDIRGFVNETGKMFFEIINEIQVFIETKTTKK